MMTAAPPETRTYAAGTEIDALTAFTADSAQWVRAGWQAVAKHWTGHELVVTYMVSPTPTAARQQAAAPSIPSSFPGGVRLAPDQRQAILARQVALAVANGARVQSQDAFQAVVVYGKPVNHVLHAILSILLIGLWLIVWLIVGLTGGEKRQLIQVDEYGQVHSRAV
jgi:hypothetical protein